MLLQIDPRLKSILIAQLLYVALAAIWNITGVILIANDLKAPGPTASLIAASILIILALAMIYGSARNLWLYRIIATLFSIGAIAAIYPPLTADPSLWPSDFWRYVGLALNVFGLITHNCGLFLSFSTGKKVINNS